MSETVTYTEGSVLSLTAAPAGSTAQVHWISKGEDGVVDDDVEDCALIGWAVVVTRSALRGGGYDGDDAERWSIRTEIQPVILVGLTQPSTLWELRDQYEDGRVWTKCFLGGGPDVG